MTEYCDVERARECRRQQENATDKFCKGFAILVVGGFWLLVVSLCIVEWTR